MIELRAYAVILAGGNGERFWPLSTREHPKQFLSLVGGKAMLTLAVERLNGLFPPERILIITAERLVEVTREVAPNLPPENIVGEPCKRDTAAAVACACGIIRSREAGEAVVCILTADQLIEKEEVFRQTLRDAIAVADDRDGIVTIGIPPSYPATGFGYIDVGQNVITGTTTVFHAAKRFVEKPDAKTAEEYWKSGAFFWNAGMFIWKTSVMQEALRQYAPSLARLADELAAARTAEKTAAVMATEYPPLSSISIDYAVMEHVKNILVASGTFGWDDVGSWPSLAAHLPPDDDGNTVVGDCERLDAKDNIVISNGRLTALIGVENLVIVQTDNVTLVCPKSRAQQIKQLLGRISTRTDAQKFL